MIIRMESIPNFRIFFELVRNITKSNSDCGKLEMLWIRIYFLIGKGSFAFIISMLWIMIKHVGCIEYQSIDHLLHGNHIADLLYFHWKPSTDGFKILDVMRVVISLHLFDELCSYQISIQNNLTCGFLNRQVLQQDWTEKLPVKITLR